MNITDATFNNKALVRFILLMLVVGGILSFLKMSRYEDPELKVKEALIITQYPGASAHEVELQVTKPIERAIRSVTGVDEIKSRSMGNFSEVHISLKTTVPDDEVEQRWDLLRRKVLNVQSELPEGAMTPLVLDDFGDMYGMFYSLSSDGHSYEEMKEYADLIKRDIEKIKGVRQVQIYGYREPVVSIKLSQERMAKLGVHPADIVMTLQSQNQTVYSGGFESGDERIRVVIDKNFNTIEDIRSVIIQGYEQDQIELGDIATVEKEYQNPYSMVMFRNGRNALGIAISAESGTNVVEIGKKVNEEIETLIKRVPLGLTFDKVFFQPEKVETAINSFVVNLIESVLIVVVVLMLTMGLRSGVLIGVGLVLTILATVVILYFTGGSLQRVSLGAFIVAMGMLVDNAIVVVDGILIDLQHGKDRHTALRRTANKTAMPLLAATLIAIAAFLPIFLSPDSTGTYTRDLFVVLAVSLLVSWVLALTQIPLLASRMIHVKKQSSEKEPYTGKVYQAFRRSVEICIKHRITAIVVMVILLAVSLFSMKYVKQAFFPNLAYDQMYIEYNLPGDASTDAVKADLLEIENHLRSMPEVINVTTSLGSTPARYCLVRSMGELSTGYGELIVDCKDYETVLKVKPVIQKYINENYPEAYARVRLHNLIILTTHLVEVMFTGPDPAVLRTLAAEAEEIFKNEPGAFGVKNDWEPTGKTLSVHYSQSQGRNAGISRMDVANALMSATDGLPIGKMYEGKEGLPIYLKTVDTNNEPVQRLEDIPVWSLGGLPSSLDQIAQGNFNPDELKENLLTSTPLSRITNGIDITSEELLVRRFNGERAITVKCDPAEGYTAAEVRNSMKESIEAIELPEGYSMIWRGEYYNEQDAMQYVIKFLPVAVVLMIVILIAMFRDFRKPAIILLSIPFAVIGIAGGLLLFGKELGFMAMVGIIGLMGMMIKNGVVLIEEIDNEIHEGRAPYDAVIHSSVARMRPVVMASVTTILGMIPLLKDAMFGSMAVTIMCGLLIGTLITLIFVPVLYTVMFNVEPVQS